MRKIALPNYPTGGFDLFLVDRQIIDELNRIREKNTNIMSLIYWLGFKPIMIPYVRRSRKKGKSRWTLSKKFKLFVDTFVAFSYYPIRALSVVGLLVALLSFLYGLLVFLLWLRNDIPVQGYVPIMLAIAFTSGIQMTMLGVLGEYLWRALDEIRRRPPFDIDEVDSTTKLPGKKTFLTYASAVPYENEFFLSEFPILRALVRLSSQYQNTLSVMIDTDSAKLFEISLEGLMGESHIENYGPGRHDQGGWAQMRYQRHIKDHMNKHHKEVAEQLTELFDSGKWKRVVLIGQDRITANFKAFLPERVRQQIADTFSMDFSEDPSTVLRQVSECLLQRERDEISRQIQELKERAPQNGLATFGLNGTLEALNGGQVHTLYLLASFSHSGGKCSRCNALILDHPSGKKPTPCPFCKERRNGQN